MKVTGYLLFSLGSLFGLLLVVDKIGGASVPPTAFILSAMLTATGLKFASFSRRAKRPSTSAAKEASTTELPLTPEMKALIGTLLSRSRRTICWIAAGILILSVLAGLAFRAAVPEPERVMAFLIPVAMGFVGAAAITLAWLVFGEGPARRDRKATAYLRTKGEVAVAAIPAGTVVRVGDQAFLANSGPTVNTLRTLSAATVDHSRHAHVIFEIRDSAGTTVYRLPGYSAREVSR